MTVPHLAGEINLSEKEVGKAAIGLKKKAAPGNGPDHDHDEEEYSVVVFVYRLL